MITNLRKRIYGASYLYNYYQEGIGKFSCYISSVLKEVKNMISFETAFGYESSIVLKKKFYSPKINTVINQILCQFVGFTN
jgi:hypothetical protein